MTTLHILLVALVQGVTEFLPISSSAHLILLPYFAHLPDQGPLIDVAAHVGTLLAVLVAFRKEVAQAVWGMVDMLAGRWGTWEARLAKYLIVGTIPVVVIGFALSKLGLMEAMRSIKVIGWTTLIFGVALYVADRWSPVTRAMTSLKMPEAVILGFAQAIALIPGVSRSGITMTAARFLGLSRPDAARFSMLMAIPTIMAAGALATKDMIEAGDMTVGMDAILVAVLSFVAALIAIALLLRWLSKATMTPFVIYRIVMGAGLLWLAYGSGAGL